MIYYTLLGRNLGAYRTKQSITSLWVQLTVRMVSQKVSWRARWLDDFFFDRFRGLIFLFARLISADVIWHRRSGGALNISSGMSSLLPCFCFKLFEMNSRGSFLLVSWLCSPSRSMTSSSFSRLVSIWALQVLTVQRHRLPSWVSRSFRNL